MLLAIMRRALVCEAVLSRAPWVCLVRVSMCTLPMAMATTSAATAISLIFLDVILRNTVLIHVHTIILWFLIIVLIAIIILIVIFILPVRTTRQKWSNLWFRLLIGLVLGLRHNFRTHGRSDLRWLLLRCGNLWVLIGVRSD